MDERHGPCDRRLSVWAKRLGQDGQTAFLDMYGQKLAQAYPAGPNGTLFPFRRACSLLRSAISPDNTPGHPAAHGGRLIPAKPTRGQSTTRGVEGLLCQTARTKRAIFTLAGAVFATMLGNGMVMPFIPVYVAQFGLGGLGAGLLFSVHAATRTVLMPFIGRASDRWGRRGFLLIGVLFYAVASLAYPLADRVAAFVGIMAVHGTGMAIVHLVSMAYVGGPGTAW